MLADVKLPVTFWAEVVNTACYVQNRVLVNKSHNKTPYELFNGRSPAIGFLKPFGCHVMILNTLDNLGKFEEKRDEGYFIGYSMSRKEFRVFNKITRRIEENLHVEFLENKAIKKGSGPNWLFDIDSLTKSMNYVPVDAGTISTNLSGTKDAARQEVKKDISSLRYIALPNWAHDALLEFSSSQPQDHCSTEVPEGMETPISTVSSPVPTAYSTDSQEPSSDARLISKRVANQAETPSLDNILSLTNRFEDILGNTTYSDESNGEKADISNMEIAITSSPTPTLRIHKDHLKSQIIGPVDTPIQTRNKSKETFVDCPKGVRPIGTKWVLKNKKDERGIVIRNKARLVAQGHTQEEGIEYDEIFAPVARIEAIRLFFAYASFMGFVVYQMDVKSAFLYGTTDEEVSSNTPMDKENPWGKEGTGKDVDLYLYRSMIGSLMYLTASRLDIMFAVCAYARHQVTNKECHLHAVKRIFRYLKGHPKLGLWYTKDSPFDLVSFLDSDYGGATQDRKSTTGGCQFLGRREVSILSCEHWNGTSKFWGVLRILMISLRLIPLGKIVGNKMHKAFPLLTIQFPLPEQLPTASKVGSHCLKKCEATTRKIALLLADEPASPVRDVSQGEACPTDSRFIADQDRVTIAKSSTLPHDSAPRAQEVEILKLKERVKVLEDREGVAATRSRDDAPIKGRSMDMDEGEAATERISDDTEEMATVLTSMDAAIVLARGIDDVPTGSGSIPTAGPPGADILTCSDVVPTASLVFATAIVVTSYSRRKGKEVMVEATREREDKRMSEQIARDAEVARILAEEELQSMIDGLDRNNETIAKYLQEYQQFAAELPLERRIELISDLEEAERYKRKGIRFDQESLKKLKSLEEVIKEAKSTAKIPKEKIKEMMQLIPIEEVYVEYLQVKHLIIDWKVYKEGQRSY
nr:hypothetical protein [Tanacetum cinerariifolium]